MSCALSGHNDDLSEPERVVGTGRWSIFDDFLPGALGSDRSSLPSSPGRGIAAASLFFLSLPLLDKPSSPLAWVGYLLSCGYAVIGS